MKILQVAPIEEPVPPHKYGGTELVVFNVTEGMVEAGHEVYLVASGNSQTNSKLIPVLEKSIREMFPNEEIQRWRDFYKIFHLSRILEIVREVKPDIVHNHINWRMTMFSNFLECPMMTTIHGPISHLLERETYSRFPQANYVSISNSQRKAMPNLNWVKTVYNGIDERVYEFRDKKDGYFAFLGRTSPEKGLAEICRLIKKTRHKLKIAAKVDAVDVEYFAREIEPYIDGEQIQFIGEVDIEGKNKLLKGAKGLLLWLNWEEPFGLVVPEANACGTPVIVNKRGSMPELVLDGETGFLVDSLEEMASKLDLVEKIDPRVCREHVVRNFSRKKMTSEYLKLAEELVAKSH